MIESTTSYDEWHDSHNRKMLKDHVVPSKETKDLLRAIENLVTVRGYRVQEKTLDIWIDTSTIEIKLVRDLEKLGLIVAHITSYMMPPDNTLSYMHITQCIATHKNGDIFGLPDISFP